MSFRNTLLVLLFGGTLGMALLREQSRNSLDMVDGWHREFLKANPGEPFAPAAVQHPSIVFARIDDGDQKRPVFSTWPLSEPDWLIVLQNLPGYAPKVTALSADLPFPKATGALDAAAKAVPSFCVTPLLSASGSDGGTSLPDYLPVLKVNGSPTEVPEFKSIRDCPFPGLPAAGRIDLLAPKKGGVSVEGDWCRVPMLARMGDKVVPSLALRALLAWADVSPSDVTVNLGSAIQAGKAFRIEIDTGGFFRFFISLAPPVPAVNLDDFVLTREQSEEHLPRDSRDRDILFKRLKGGLLWLGLNDVPSRTLRDPTGTLVSTADLTARAIAVIQTKTHLLPLAPDRQWITPALTLLFCVWLTHWRKSRLWPGALVAIISLIAVSLWFYRRDHLWIPLVPSVALVLATLILSYILPTPKPKLLPDPGTGTGSRRTVRSARSTRSTRSVRTSTRPPASAARDATTRDPVLITEELSPRSAPAPEESAAEPAPDDTAAYEWRHPVAPPHEGFYEAAPETETAGEIENNDTDDESDEEEEEQQDPSSPQQLARPERQSKKKKKRRH